MQDIVLVLYVFPYLFFLSCMLIIIGGNEDMYCQVSNIRHTLVGN